MKIGEAAMALAWVPLCCLPGVPGAMSDQCLVWQIGTLRRVAAASVFVPLLPSQGCLPRPPHTAPVNGCHHWNTWSFSHCTVRVTETDFQRSPSSTEPLSVALGSAIHALMSQTQVGTGQLFPRHLAAFFTATNSPRKKSRPQHVALSCPLTSSG